MSLWKCFLRSENSELANGGISVFGNKWVLSSWSSCPFFQIHGVKRDSFALSWGTATGSAGLDIGLLVKETLTVFMAHKMGEKSHGRSAYKSFCNAGSIKAANFMATQAPVGGSTFLSNSVPKTISSAENSYSSQYETSLTFLNLPEICRENKRRFPSKYSMLEGASSVGFL